MSLPCGASTRQNVLNKRVASPGTQGLLICPSAQTAVVRDSHRSPPRFNVTCCRTALQAVSVCHMDNEFKTSTNKRFGLPTVQFLAVHEDREVDGVSRVRDVISSCGQTRNAKDSRFSISLPHFPAAFTMKEQKITIWSGIQKSQHVLDHIFLVLLVL